MADDLAEDEDLVPQWRDAWLRGPEIVGYSEDVYPTTREDLDAMARMIGERLRWIEGMRRTLRGEGAEA